MVNLVTGGGDDVGTALIVRRHDVRVVSFTGSTDVGPHRHPGAPRRTFKKVHLEMGGKNVIMVMDDADLELAVDGCLWGGFGTTGQRCTAASRVVVHEKVYERVPRAVRGARARRCASATASIRRRRWARRSAQAQLETVMEYVEIGQRGRRDAGAAAATR